MIPDPPNFAVLLLQFKTACSLLGVSERAALRAGGIDPSLWAKWEAGRVSPTFRSFDAAWKGIKTLQREAASQKPKRVAA